MVERDGRCLVAPGRSIRPIWRLCPVAYATRAAANCAILETPTFPAPGRTEQAGACLGSRGHRRQPRQIVLSAPLRMVSQTPFYIFTAFVFTYGTTVLHSSRSDPHRGTHGLVISFFSIPFSGYLSDRIGQGACAIAARSLTITLLLSSRAGARRSSPRPCSPNTNGAIAPSRSDL